MIGLSRSSIGSDACSIEKTVANFFTPASQKKPEPITWRILGTSLIVGKYVPEKSAPQTVSEQARRIASFDLVGDPSISSPSKKAGMKY
jgi:hypothetical protein